MRTRDQKARIHFTEEELRDLDRKAAAAGLDRCDTPSWTESSRCAC